MYLCDFGRLRHLYLAATIVLSIASLSGRDVHAYPAGPVQIIVPVTAGGDADQPAVWQLTLETQ